MNHLELKHFNNIDRFVNSTFYKEAFESYRELIPHKVLLTYKGNQGGKRIMNFSEFYIDGTALYVLLDEFYEHTAPLVNSWVGELGIFPKNLTFDKLKVKLFLQEEIREEEILAYLKEDCFAAFSKRELEYQLYSLTTSFEEEESIFYTCQLCLDYACGGYYGKITKSDGQYSWTFKTEEKTLVFHFEEQQYQETFNTYLNN